MTVYRKYLATFLCVALAAVASACGSDGTPTDDVNDVIVADTQSDAIRDVAAETSDEGTTDALVDTFVPPACADLIASRDMLHLLESEGRLIVHLNAAFDGQAIWLGWTSFSDATGFGTIRAARMACDGTFLVQPFDVDPDNAGNSYEAEIAVGGGNVFIAWHQDYQGYYTARSGVRSGSGPAMMFPPPSDVIEPDVIDDVPADVPQTDVTDVTDTTDVTDATEPDAADATQTDVADTAAPDAIEDTSTDASDPPTDVIVFPNDNMRVYYRIYTFDGSPLMDHAERFLPMPAGTTEPASNWIPKVAAMQDGRFVVSCSWACPEGHSFQAVAQRFNPDGTLSGGLIRPYPIDWHDQTYTDVAVDNQDNIRITWGDTEIIDGEPQKTRIAAVTIPPDADEPIENSPVFFETTGDNPSVSFNWSNVAFTVWMTDETIPNIAAAAEMPDRTATGTAKFGDSAWYDTYPMVVAGPSGAAAVWYRWSLTKDPETGAYPPIDVKFAKLAWAGTGNITSIGDPLTVNPSTETVDHGAVQYYEPVIIDVGSGNYFVMWTESYCDPCAQPAGTGADATAAVEAVWHYPAYARFIKP